MKKLKFESNGSEWLLVDENDEGKVIHPDGEYHIYVRLKDITEEQASEVVEGGDATPHLCSYFVGYRDYMSYEDDYRIDSCVESLHSLLKSKGIYLYENPAPLLSSSRLDAEYKTFYNPILFKIL